MSAQTQKIAIIGGGISGLSLAYRLEHIFKENNRLCEIHLFEKKSVLGGTIQTESRDGFILEKGPDGFIQQKTTVYELAKELGIDSELIGTQSENRRSMILQNNCLMEVPDGFYLMSPSKIIPFLQSPLLSWKGKIRTLLEVFVPTKKTDQEESLADFVRRRFGKENLDKISQAMLGGIYTADPEALSMQAALPRFVEMEKRYGSITRGILTTMTSQKNISGARYSLFGSFKNGMSTLVQALEKKLTDVQINRNTNIQSIRYSPNEKLWQLNLNDQTIAFDHVCFAIAPHQITHLMPSLNEEEKKLMESVPYASSAIFHFGFRSNQIKNKPKAVGFIVPHRENKHFIACSFLSDKYGFRAPDGYSLLRVFAGGALQEHLLRTPREQLRNKIFAELQSILAIEGEPILEDCAVWPHSMPQYTMGHLDRVMKIKNILNTFPNLHVVGNGYGGVGIPDLIENADQTAKKILN